MKWVTGRLTPAGAIMIPILLSVPISNGQGADQKRSPTPISEARVVESVKPNAPKFTEYRGVRIGMNADDARQKLGKPKVTDKTQDLFVFSNNNETAQIFYDAQQRIYAISIDFAGKGTAAPAAIDVLGQDIKAKADGSMYRMQQYPEAGYWVSYNRTGGDSPLITVTMQKIPGSKQ